MTKQAAEKKLRNYVTPRFCTLSVLVKTTLAIWPHGAAHTNLILGHRLVAVKHKTISPCALTHLLLLLLYPLNSPQAQN